MAMSIRVKVAKVVVAGGAVLVAAAAQAGMAEHLGQSASAAVTSPRAASATVPATGTQPRTLRFGDSNADVTKLQERLRALHYDPGTVNGRYGQPTQLALFAFEKVNRLSLNGTVGDTVWKALDAPRSPQPLVRGGEKERVEIDLSRQLLYVYRGGKIVLISHISSGGDYRFCTTDPGAKTPRCRRSVTPTGDYLTGRRVGDWDKGPLGSLYKPVYFNGGIAVHGLPSVPLTPVSHGCVRVPMHTADLFQQLVGTGVAVHVRRTA
jgi:peptidoglycan hydrolase-like protein with peptidoglycan-binding domain